MQAGSQSEGIYHRELLIINMLMVFTVYFSGHLSNTTTCIHISGLIGTARLIALARFSLLHLALKSAKIITFHNVLFRSSLSLAKNV